MNMVSILDFDLDFRWYITKSTISQPQPQPSPLTQLPSSCGAMATLTTASIASEPSSAEHSVRKVASRLGIPNVEHVVEQMKQEYVLTDWQLSALDSFQWKSLGAPIGLAVAVHQIIQQQQQQQQQDKPYVLPSDNRTEMTQESKSLHDSDQHNNIMELADLGIHNSTDEEEKEESVDAEENNCTVVDAAIQERSMDNEAEKDEKCQNSESMVTDASEPDATSKEEDFLAEEPVTDTDDEKSSTENDHPDETYAAPPETSKATVIEETISIESPPPPQEPEVCDADANITDADTNTKSSRSLENVSDQAVALPDTPDIAPDEEKTPSTKNSPLDELEVVEESKRDASSNDESALPQALGDDDESVGPQNAADDVFDAEPEAPPPSSSTSVVESSSSMNGIDKSPSEEESSETGDAADVDTIPTISTSEESTTEHNDEPAAISPTTTLLSAPLPHDECDDSFHVSEGKELLLKPSFDSEDISEDLDSFAAENEETGGVEEDDEENTEQLEPSFIQEEENSQDLDDSFGYNEDEMDEEESLDTEDDIIISGQDLLVDLSGEPPQDPPQLSSIMMEDKQQRHTDDPFEVSFGQFRTPLVDPNSVTITEFRTSGSDLDYYEDGGHDQGERTGTGTGTGSTEDPSLSKPFVMHKRTVSSLESLYYVDGDASTVVASNVSPERIRDRPKRRRSLEDSTHHTIHTLSHVSSFDVEWDEFCIVLGQVPSKTQRTILSQLLIMTNGRTKAARYKMAKQVSQMILKSAPRSEDATERKTQTAQLRSNLQLFAKLHREERKALGKKIFEQISKLYAGGGDDDSKKNKEKDKKKKKSVKQSPPSNDKDAPTNEAVMIDDQAADEDIQS